MTVNDAVYGSVTYEIHKSRISIRLTAPYSEERRKAARENAKKHMVNVAKPQQTATNCNKLIV